MKPRLSNFYLIHAEKVHFWSRVPQRSYRNLAALTFPNPAPPGSNLTPFVGLYQSQTLLGTGFISLFPPFSVSLIQIKEPFRGFRPTQACVQQENSGFNTWTRLSISVYTGEKGLHLGTWMFN